MIEPVQSTTSPCYVKVHVPPGVKTKPLVICITPQAAVQASAVVITHGNISVEKKPLASESSNRTSGDSSALIYEHVNESNMLCDNLNEQNGVSMYTHSQETQSTGKLLVLSECSRGVDKPHIFGENVFTIEGEQIDKSSEGGKLLNPSAQWDGSLEEIVSVGVLPSVKVEKPDDGFVKCVKDHDLSVLSNTVMESEMLPQDTGASSSSHMHASASCEMCYVEFTTNTELLQHICTGESKKIHSCEACFKKFGDKLALCRHMTFHVNGEAEQFAQEGGLVEFSDCNKSFEDTSELSSEHLTRKTELQDDGRESQLETTPLLVCKVEEPDISKAEEGYKCITCCKFFTTSSELSQHVLTHASNESHMCKVCLKKFDENSHLMTHVCTRTSDVKKDAHTKLQVRKRNKCKKCSRNFVTKWELLAHMTGHAVLDSHQGGKKSRFRSPRHVQTRSIVKVSYGKQDCNRNLCSTEEVQTICDTNEGSCDPVTQVNPNPERICKLLDNNASGESIEESTQSSNISGNLLMICKVEVPDENFIKVEEGDEFLNGGLHSCNTCSMKFATKLEFSRHVCTHMSKKFCVCDVCFKTFSERYTLNRHMATHASAKAMECTECSKKFSRKDTLMRHVRLHQKEKQHECEKCHERFQQKHQLLAHMDDHDTFESNSCVICSQRFLKHQFSMHMLTHVHSGFWACPVCSKDYKKKSSLLWHFKSCHEEGKPHECRKCLKSFKTRLDLRKHVLTDKNDTSYDCVENEVTPEGEMFGLSEDLELGSNSSEKTAEVEKASSETGISQGENSAQGSTKSAAVVENFSTNKELYECEVCPQKFLSETDLSSHRLSHKRKLHKCDICTKEFTQVSHLSRHMACHRDEKTFKCEICLEKFLRKENLTRHLLNHAGERPHKCKVCSKRFTMKGDLTMHMLVHTGQRSHLCSLCPKTFARKSHLSRHMLTHTGEKPHVCSACPEKFARKTDLTMHEATHKGERADECQVCHKKFARRDNLAKHLLTHKGLKPHKCSICSWKFARKYNLTKHMLTHTGVRDHQCEICEKKFVTKSNLFIHLLTHTREKLFECDICCKKFTTKSNVKVHMLLHKEGTEFECEVCTKKFRNKYRLARHLSVTHMGMKKKHSCSVCFKKFTSKFLVQRHMLTHTGQKEHKCEICSKRFGQKETLTRHMLIHSGEKPHQCTICFKKFTQRMALSKHLLIHTGELPYECDFCPRKFTHRNYLSRHLLTHTEEGATEENEPIQDSV